MFVSGCKITTFYQYSKAFKSFLILIFEQYYKFIPSHLNNLTICKQQGFSALQFERAAKSTNI